MPEEDHLSRIGVFIASVTGWWQLKEFLIFNPKIGEDEPILTCAYFSDRLVKNHQPGKHDGDYLPEGLRWMDPFFLDPPVKVESSFWKNW